MGDAEGGTECKVAIDSTSHECIIACLTKKKRNPNINRVTMRSNLKGNWKTCKLIGNVCKVLLNLALYPTLLEYSMLRNREHVFLFQEFFERFSNGMNQICLYYSTCSKVFFNFNNATDNTTTTATTTTTILLLLLLLLLLIIIIVIIIPMSFLFILLLLLLFREKVY